MSAEPSQTELVAAIAQMWQAQTKQDLHLRTVERIFFKFLQEGFQSDDLRCVLVWIKWKNNQSGHKRQINLRLVLDHDAEIPFAKFACDLGEARAWERNRRPAPTPKEKALSQFRPAIGENLTTTGAMSVKEIMQKIVNPPPC